jgi:hypothetical protein
MAIKKGNLAIQASDHLFPQIFAAAHCNDRFDSVPESSNQQFSHCNAAAWYQQENVLQR